MELPPLVRILQPLEEPPALLVVGDVEAELDHFGAAADELLLEAIDDFVAALDHVRLGQVVHPRYEYVFVMRAVEDAHLTFGRQPLANAPEEAVALLLRCRCLACG